MLTSDEIIAEVNFLTQSPVRFQILELLYEERDLTQSELNERMDVSRVTVQRNVQALEERDWIDNSHPTYSITPLGELVIEDVEPLAESLTLTRKLRPFLKWLPRGAFDLDPRHLTDATILPVDPTDPYNWVSYHMERLSSVSRVRMTLPMIGDEALDVLSERVLADELEAESVADPEVARTLRTNPRYTGTVEELLGTDRFELYVYEGRLSYGVGVFDKFVQMIVADDEGMPQALVETESEVVRDWAADRIEYHRDRAEPFDL